jgi:hypothetical protein
LFLFANRLIFIAPVHLLSELSTLSPSMNIRLPSVELEPVERQGLRQLDRLTAVSLIYLGIPVALFLVGWMRIPFALALLVLLGLAFYLVWRISHTNAQPSRFGLLNLVILCVALGWLCFGGAGHILYANKFDWTVRYAVLHDLTQASWPPGYDIGGSVLWFLRCPVGYYLPAALCGKIFGLVTADAFLYLWTAAGVAIFLSLLPIQSRSVGRMVLAFMVVVFFSGMDVLGWLTLWGFYPPLYKHLEWWAQLFQYSSNTTLLFWAPNHALPAWIAAALFWRHWKTDAFIAISPLLISLLPVWSPFAVIGMLPFYALLLYRIVREKKFREISLPLLGISILLTVAAIAYLSMDVASIPGSASMDDTYFTLFFERYPLFVILEFGALAALLWTSNRGLVFYLSLVVLLALPFIRFGANNDFAMRASIPALAIVCINALEFLQRPSKETRGATIAVCVVLLFGAVTPFHEFNRAVSFPRWDPSPTTTVMDFGPVPPSSYVCRYEDTWMRFFFRDPAGILKTTPPAQPVRYRPEEYP